jgi:Spy/CpxP family protein refolding chaperone
MKKILLLAVCTLMATAAHAQSASGDAANERMNRNESKLDTAAGLNGHGTCKDCQDKNAWNGPIKANSAATQKSGSGSSDNSPAQGQGGVNDQR